MANTQKFLGTDLLVYIGSVAVGHSRSASLKMSSQLADATTKDSTDAFTEYIPSIKSWEISTEGLLVWGDVNQWYNAIKDGTPLTISFKPSLAATGDLILSGVAYLENFEVSADNGEVVTYSVSFKGSGVLDGTPKA